MNENAVSSLKRTSRHAGGGHQAGVTLIEALVALVVMSFGMIALVSLMGNLRFGADLAKQRGEAMRLAQAELETLRSYSLLTSADPSVVTFDDSDVALDSIKNSTRVVTPETSNTTFTVTRTVDPVKVDELVVAKSVRVMVTWTDRTGVDGSASKKGAPQSVTLDTLISRVDPSFSGSLGINAPDGGTRQPGARHPAIPVSAKDLGDKRSAFRPSDLGSTVWVFNNLTGVIVSTCSLAPSSELTASTLVGTCADEFAYLLSGSVRFSYTSPANPTLPEGSAMPLDLAIRQGFYVTPRVDATTRIAKKTPTGDLIWDTVTVQEPPFPADAAASAPAFTYVALPLHTCIDDAPSTTPTTQTVVNYNCIVRPDSVSKRWSGKLDLTGITIGMTSSEYRVCRYSADYNGNGTEYTKTGDYVIDNYEHPAVYSNVAGSLVRQNFLVIKGNVSCPTAPAVDSSARVFVDYSTKHHQP
ncbi:MAG: hypothetical protein EON93_01540 [Burkholderiales bacterium]|nr:MAG: hypothetical protein EON93_01540 [Burkholderiales bacterium]